LALPDRLLRLIASDAVILSLIYAVNYGLAFRPVLNAMEGNGNLDEADQVDQPGPIVALGCLVRLAGDGSQAYQDSREEPQHEAQGDAR